jgi:tRNA nucleotidyltransferase (CCA-adding enzyme)
VTNGRAAAAVSIRFAEYLERVQPRAGILNTAVQRTTDIQRAMLRSMQISRVVRVGSFYKKTAIDGASDLDFFVVLRRDEVRWGGDVVASTTVLSNVR